MSTEFNQLLSEVAKLTSRVDALEGKKTAATQKSWDEYCEEEERTILGRTNLPIKIGDVVLAVAYNLSIREGYDPRSKGLLVLDTIFLYQAYGFEGSWRAEIKSEKLEEAKRIVAEAFE